MTWFLVAFWQDSSRYYVKPYRLNSDANFNYLEVGGRYCL